ncbi:transposase [Streptomyces sp. CJ_13]|nr:transposase [Streptomyces sp. CJ_13]
MVEVVHNAVRELEGAGRQRRGAGQVGEVPGYSALLVLGDRGMPSREVEERARRAASRAWREEPRPTLSGTSRDSAAEVPSPVAGQRADCTQFVPVLEKIRVPRLGPGRPRKSPPASRQTRDTASALPRVRAASGYPAHDSGEVDSQAARLRKGSRGGRPPGFDEEQYEKRNTVERAINRLKNSRAAATRYDKRGYVFLGTVTAAALVIWLRS